MNSQKIRLVIDKILTSLADFCFKNEKMSDFSASERKNWEWAMICIKMHLYMNSLIDGKFVFAC